MWNGLWKLTWLEIKIFRREPMGVFGSVIFPVLPFLILGRLFGGRVSSASFPIGGFVRVSIPVFVSILIVLSTVLSLITIISLYREGGILKRLRATPLRPVTILTAHVLVKLVITAIAMFLLVLAGKHYFPADVRFPVVDFTVAELVASWSLLSLGFVIASFVPTARFAQPIGAMILYPMFAVCGLFVPVQSMPPVLRAIARLTPLTYAVSLLQGVMAGDSVWAHWADIGALAAVFAICMLLSSRIFRWE